MYVVRCSELKDAIDPDRHLVKLSDPNLWKPPWHEGEQEWKRGHEIRSESIGISLFTTGTAEKVHYHERTWELYQVLEGCLKIAVKHYRRGLWTPVVLNVHDMLLLPPGTLHLADSGYEHMTQVIQAPPALSDQILISDPHEIKLAENIPWWPVKA